MNICFPVSLKGENFIPKVQRFKDIFKFVNNKLRFTECQNTQKGLI